VLIGPNNQLLSDGTYDYTYDAEGNRTSRTNIATGEVTAYAWDYRNRLTQVTSLDASNNVTQTVKYTYDVNNNRIAEVRRVGHAIELGKVRTSLRLVEAADVAHLIGPPRARTSRRKSSLPERGGPIGLARRCAPTKMNRPAMLRRHGNAWPTLRLVERVGVRDRFVGRAVAGDVIARRVPVDGRVGRPNNDSRPL
jgi:hypothetical protein